MRKSVRTRSSSNFAVSQANNTFSTSVIGSSQVLSNDVAIFPATSFFNTSTSQEPLWTLLPAISMSIFARSRAQILPRRTFERGQERCWQQERYRSSKNLPRKPKQRKISCKRLKQLREC